MWSMELLLCIDDAFTLLLYEWVVSQSQGHHIEDVINTSLLGNHYQLMYDECIRLEWKRIGITGEMIHTIKQKNTRDSTVEDNQEM
jgi:hypothetical protein